MGQDLLRPVWQSRDGSSGLRCSPERVPGTPLLYWSSGRKSTLGHREAGIQ